MFGFVTCLLSLSLSLSLSLLLFILLSAGFVQQRIWSEYSRASAAKDAAETSPCAFDKYPVIIFCVCLCSSKTLYKLLFFSLLSNEGISAAVICYICV